VAPLLGRSSRHEGPHWTTGDNANKRRLGCMRAAALDQHRNSAAPPVARSGLAFSSGVAGQTPYSVLIVIIAMQSLVLIMQMFVEILLGYN